MIIKYKIEGKNNPIFLKLFVDNRVKITDHIKFQLHSDKSTHLELKREYAISTSSAFDIFNLLYIIY